VRENDDVPEGNDWECLVDFHQDPCRRKGAGGRGKKASETANPFPLLPISFPLY
jgi:hypothetical protein